MNEASLEESQIRMKSRRLPSKKSNSFICQQTIWWWKSFFFHPMMVELEVRSSSYHRTRLGEEMKAMWKPTQHRRLRPSARAVRAAAALGRAKKIHGRLEKRRRVGGERIPLPRPPPPGALPRARDTNRWLMSNYGAEDESAFYAKYTRWWFSLPRAWLGIVFMEGGGEDRRVFALWFVAEYAIRLLFERWKFNRVRPLNRKWWQTEN